MEQHEIIYKHSDVVAAAAAAVVVSRATFQRFTNLHEAPESHLRPKLTLTQTLGSSRDRAECCTRDEKNPRHKVHDDFRKCSVIHLRRKKERK